MIKSENEERRSFLQKTIHADLVVTGGGLAGTCCAITAAREGMKVVLVQDRPVLGGNSSSEIRLWVLGATSHMGNNNRWAREGGVIDEILVENMYRNPEGNAVIFDTVVLDKVVNEKNITLLLNTAVIEVEKFNRTKIKGLKAFCSQNSTAYNLVAPLFCDASGDGVVGFLAGAAFRMGAESREEFGELFAPDNEYGELLGHSIYFYTKDTGRPVNFVPPSFALDDITKIPRYKKFNASEQGCQLWWIEYGGRLDTVHDTENIKWELWRVVYGVWNHIKNSGLFPEAENLTLEWVGTIPGKRESRRFEGDYILTQQDIIEQRFHRDAVAYGGWSVDLHPADGVFSERPGCNQWHSKGIYSIPYRCYYSKNIDNLFLAGRIISVSHVAFGSSRVMGTSAYGGQAVGIAAALCKERNLLPRQISEQVLEEMQQRLLMSGQFIPAIEVIAPENLAAKAHVDASSNFVLAELPEGGILKTLDPAAGQLLPFKKGKVPELIVHAEADESTVLQVELRTCERSGSFTPDRFHEAISISMSPGRNCIHLNFKTVLDDQGYAFILFKKNPRVHLHFSAQRITGILSVFNLVNEAVSNYGKQTPPDGIGVDSFEFWCPQRRPQGQNIAVKINPPLDCFSPGNVINGVDRPVLAPNAWVADLHDDKPQLRLNWETKKTIRKIVLSFDTDFDHPMETVLMGHPESIMPFCVRSYRIIGDGNKILFEKNNNYQTRNIIEFDDPVITKQLIIQVDHPAEDIPASVFGVWCF
ncbi:FAD-dependent oxidoreductase [Chryseolinea sp. H1M3-3]|uniref:FAD-dependent oxidoreductase n=1 Tax=Chryseolinea sp. H1M3-3 TaxID=3034144 RepID=UPI0023ED6E44|nr:FAD-dependent oxidoreductase [Chryseolinea sp. H1M3-3]